MSNQIKKILECYPFANNGVELIEGFAVYDGSLKDPIGEPHKGIDYVLRSNNKFIGFDVYSMHAGHAFQGISKSWGKFVTIYHKDQRHITLYAHFRTINNTIPALSKNKTIKSKNILTKACTHLGIAGTTGKTNRIPQLHIELHERNSESGDRIKLDPYGLYERFSSGNYPQPGKSLKDLKHLWTTNNPPLANQLAK